VQSRFHGKRVAAVGFACTYGILPPALSRRPQLARRQCRPTEPIPPLVVYDRAGDGTLSQAGAYATGGLGGQTAGSAADHLSSQGSLGYDRRDGLVVAGQVHALVPRAYVAEERHEGTLVPRR